MELGDFLTSINFSKKNLMLDLETLEEVEKSYNPYIVNRLLSYFPDAIMYSNDMNMNFFLDKRMQYEYLLYGLKPRKRYSKWLKPDVIEDLDCVKEYFGYSTTKAKEALKILSNKDLEYIKSRLNRGGLMKGKNKK